MFTGRLAFTRSFSLHCCRVRRAGCVLFYTLGLMSPNLFHTGLGRTSQQSSFSDAKLFQIIRLFLLFYSFSLSAGRMYFSGIRQLACVFSCCHVMLSIALTVSIVQPSSPLRSPKRSTAVLQNMAGGRSDQLRTGTSRPL